MVSCRLRNGANGYINAVDGVGLVINLPAGGREAFLKQRDRLWKPAAALRADIFDESSFRQTPGSISRVVRARSPSHKVNWFEKEDQNLCSGELDEAAFSIGSGGPAKNGVLSFLNCVSRVKRLG